MHVDCGPSVSYGPSGRLLLISTSFNSTSKGIGTAIMATTMRVHAWHINIDVGDSAIHLLVDEAVKPKPQLYSAVLVDGGKGSRIAAIKTVIEEIEASYVLKTGDTNLKFDSVVVTHWYE